MVSAPSARTAIAAAILAGGLRLSHDAAPVGLRTGNPLVLQPDCTGDLRAPESWRNAGGRPDRAPPHGCLTSRSAEILSPLAPDGRFLPQHGGRFPVARSRFAVATPEGGP